MLGAIEMTHWRGGDPCPRICVVYRQRHVHRRSLPDDPSRRDVICAAFREEAEVRELEKQAEDIGYELWWEEVPVRAQMSSDPPPDTVFILFEGGMDQSDPEALEFSDSVGVQNSTRALP